MIPVEELEPGDLILFRDGREADVIRVEVYEADPQYAALGLRTYASDAYIVVYRGFDRPEGLLAIKRKGDLIDALRPGDYTRKARDAAAGQARSPRLADNLAAAPATTARARPTDPVTSQAAARSLRAQELRQSQEDVLSVFRRFGPIDDVTLIDRYLELYRDGHVRAQSPSGLRTRRHELVDAGQLRDSGRKVRLESGRQAIVWERVEPLALTIDEAYDPEPDL